MKKSQAALEFFYEYGWSILVALATFGSLLYFGALSPDKFLPEKCAMPIGVECLDFTSNEQSASFIIQNLAGFDMQNTTLWIQTTDNSYVCEGDSTLNDAEKNTYTCPFTNVTTEKLKGSLNLNYTNADTGTPHTKSGEIILKVR